MTVEVYNLQGKANGGRPLNFSDDFQYTPSGAGEIANYWTMWQLNDVASESVNPECQISNGTLFYSAGGGGGTWWNRVLQPQITGGLAGLSQWAEVKLVSGTGTNGVGSFEAGPCVLAQPWGIRNTIRNGFGNGYWIWIDTEPQNTSILLSRLKDSDHLAGAFLSGNLTGRTYGSTYRITAQVGTSQNIVKVYQDGVLLFTYTDTDSQRPGSGTNGIGSQNDFTGVGAPGMFCQKGQPGFNIVFDNFRCGPGAVAP